jgi:hypothetical protein
MKHPYEQFEKTPLWRAINKAVADLERNQDVELRTAREHFIGYLCQQLSAGGIVTEGSILKEWFYEFTNPANPAAGAKFASDGN